MTTSWPVPALLKISLVTRPDRIVGHRDLGAGRAAARLGDRGQPQGVVVDIGRDPLAQGAAARQAVLHAGDVARRIVAVGQGHAGLAGPRARGRLGLQVAPVIVGEGHRGVGIVGAGHLAIGVVGEGRQVDRRARAEPALAGLAAELVVRVRDLPAIGVGRLDHLAVGVVLGRRRSRRCRY